VAPAPATGPDGVDSRTSAPARAAPVSSRTTPDRRPGAGATPAGAAATAGAPREGTIDESTSAAATRAARRAGLRFTLHSYGPGPDRGKRRATVGRKEHPPRG
jgi:hypothetical protein